MRIKLRYSTRFILLGILVFALLLVPETRRAERQRRLVSNVASLAGVCERKPRARIPDWLRGFLNEEYGSFVEKVIVGGMAATPSIGLSYDGYRPQVVTDAELGEVLSSTGMRDIEKLVLCGTAVSDDLVVGHVIAMTKLKSLVFRQTIVTEPCVERLKKALPGCVISYEAGYSSNGLSLLESYHRYQRRLTSNVGLFARAEKGDAEAVSELLGLAGEHTPEEAEPVVAAISKASSPEAIVALHDGMVSTNPRTRRAAVEALGAKRDIDALSQAVRDVDIDVRCEAVRGLAKAGGIKTLRPLRFSLEDESVRVRILATAAIGENDGQKALDTLAMAVHDESPQVRWTAVDKLANFPGEQSIEMLIGAIRDEDSTVRAAAARTLGRFPDTRSVEALTTATEDDSSFVRRNATASLRELGSGVQP